MAQQYAGSDAAQKGAFEGHLVAAGEHLRRDEVEEACEALRAALALRAGEPRALALLGLAYFRRADFESALPIYGELVTSAPDNASYRLNLGLVHLKLGNAEGAIEELSRSRELDPSQPRTVSYLGLAYARRGRYDRAYQAFLQAGEDALAEEMADYLPTELRDAIREAVENKLPGAFVDDEDDDDAEPEAPAASAADAASASRAGHAKDAKSLAGTPPPLPSARGHGPNGSSPNSASAVAASPRAAAAEEEEDEEESDDDASDALEAAAALFAPADDDGGDAEQADLGGPSVLRAVDEAVPSAAASAAATRAAVGHRPPQPVSELATDKLIRPEDGHHAFEIGAGGVLIIRVEDRLLSRTEGVIVSGGDLAYEPATRHARGSSTGEVFGGDDRPMFIISGRGQLVATPLGERFAAVTLDDDIFYLREDLVYAFEPRLQWENGYVPGSDSAIPVVQFRGQGDVAIRSRRPLLSLKLMAERVLYVDAEVLGGWIGRVIPRVVAPAAGGEGSTAFVECTGEGVVLIDDPDSSGSDGP